MSEKEMTEEQIMKKIRKCSTKTEQLLEEIEGLIKNGYPINSLEVKKIQQKLHTAELESHKWRQMMTKYL